VVFEVVPVLARDEVVPVLARDEVVPVLARDEVVPVLARDEVVPVPARDVVIPVPAIVPVPSRGTGQGRVAIITEGGDSVKGKLGWKSVSNNTTPTRPGRAQGRSTTESRRLKAESKEQRAGGGRRGKLKGCDKTTRNE
jgi:hypothetical protein